MAFTYNRKSLKKSYQLLKYAHAYLCKRRYAPDGCLLYNVFTLNQLGGRFIYPHLCQMY